MTGFAGFGFTTEHADSVIENKTVKVERINLWTHGMRGDSH